MRFDWYAATIQDRPQTVVETLQDAFRAEVVPTRGLHGYTQGFDLKGPAGTVARVLAGGINENPHAWASGEDTEPFVEVVRSRWKDQHTVTRMDAAEDFQAEGAWDQLNALCLAMADEQGLKVSQAGDYHRNRDGRTLYVGSRKSPVYIRLYEKGKQLRAKIEGEFGGVIPADWVRLEAQVRPQKDSKKAAAYVTPEQAWGFSAWTSELAMRSMRLDVPRVQMHVWREADDERAFRFMVKQYGHMLERLREDLGGWDCVGKQIGDAIAELRKQQRRCRMRG